VDYDFVAKMDVDLEFSPQYLERLLAEFERDPKLAAASGKVYRRERDRLVEEFIIDEMGAGQLPQRLRGDRRLRARGDVGQNRLPPRSHVGLHRRGVSTTPSCASSTCD